MKSIRQDVELLVPDVERDANFAHSWFSRSEGVATLRSMGNAEADIEISTLEKQQEIMREFIDLEEKGEQITRAITTGGITVGFVWVELVENHGIKAPSVHIMLGDPNYRGKGIGRVAMQSAIEYIRGALKLRIIYTRYLADNIPIAKLCASLGFKRDGEPYVGDDGLVWQNVILL